MAGIPTCLRRWLPRLAAVFTVLAHIETTASGQTVTCAPKEFRPSLVRIERQAPAAPGTGVVIVRRDNYAIVLTAKHVVEGVTNFAIYFQAAPDRRVPVTWDDQTMFGFPMGVDLAVFRVTAPIPEAVTADDPFTGDVPDGAALVSWGYPASRRDGTLCSHEAKLVARDAGQLIADGYVEAGISGGPMLFHDPADGAYKLVGIVVAGDGDVKSGTTRAIDIRQAVTIVATSPDPRNGGKPHVWPNIPPPDEIVVDTLLRSFTKVEAGPFVMGSNDVNDEKWPNGDGGRPGPKSVTLPIFYMGKFEVTVAQYRECVAAGACMHSGRSLSPTEGNYPVVGVTWHEARTYAGWLQRHLMARPETPRILRRLLEAGWQIDLPSEEEWEKAARRRGTDTYPWGNGSNPRAANYNTGKLRPVDAAQCADCAYRIVDMAGNAREWTRSLKLPYPYVASKAEDPTAGGNRAIRGGSAARMGTAVFASQVIRAANRQDAAAGTFDEYTGFRVALICREDRGCGWKPPD
jgi:formylglycine-generating enzyme required for sulfatase activity